MLHSSLNKIISHAASMLDVPPFPLDDFDPLQKARNSATEYLLKRLHNEHSIYDSVEFNPSRCGGHYNPRINEILECLKDTGLDSKYTLHTGEAHLSYFDGPNLDQYKQTTHPALMLRNDADGFQMEFQLEPNGEHRHDNYGHVHVLFFRRDVNRQGPFTEIKRLITGDMKAIMLDTLGYSSLHGRAAWSENSEIKNPTSRDEDWRHKPRYVGLDQNLNPILIRGIELFYLRMGFVPYIPDYLDGVHDQRVMLLSDALEIRTRDYLGEGIWSELTKYHAANHHEWHKLTKAREQELGAEKLAKRISAAKKFFEKEDH